jgi:hypothetical protein
MKDEIRMYQQLLESKYSLDNPAKDSPAAEGTGNYPYPIKRDPRGRTRAERRKERGYQQNPGSRPLPTEAEREQIEVDTQTGLNYKPSSRKEYPRTPDGELDIEAIKDAAAKRREAGEPNPLLSTPEVKPVVKKKAGKKKVAKKKVVKRPRVKKA